MSQQNDWNEYKRLLLGFRKDTKKHLLRHDQKLDTLLTSMSGMKTKLAIGTSAVAAIVAYIVAGFA